MKKKHFRLFVIVFALSFILTGCGATPLYEMTVDERDYIVHTAAHLIAKYNVKQTDGINGRIPSEEDLMEEVVEEETTEDESGIDLNEPGISGMLNFAEAIGQPNVDVTYNGMYMDTAYQEGQYYLLSADAGKKYAILKFSLRNPYVDPVKVDAFNTEPVFYANFGDDNYISQKNTFLTYSMPTFQGVVDPGKTIDLVLIFQVDEALDNSSQVKTMKVEVNGGRYYINLQN